MKYFLSLIFLLSILKISAQVEIKGLVQDDNSIPANHASILLLTEKDSVMEEFTNTDKDGKFTIKATANKKYVLQINLTGMRTYWKTIEVLSESIVLDTITLINNETILPTVQVVTYQDQMKIKKDTIEYNANAFKVLPGAPVEELLKKLPGVEVQRDGTVKAQGETIQNVLVDGKEFFGKDTRIATKNLDADAVDKVQVYNKKSDMAEFTGVADGRDEKSINLKLKPGHKNGYFGNAELHGGTDSRYKTKFNLNQFRPGSRLSLIGSGNSINEQTFSFQDYIDFMGGIGSFLSGGGGKMRIELNDNSNNALPLGNGNIQGKQKSWVTGLNWNKDISPKTELSASYMLNSIRNKLIKQTDRQSLLTEQTYNTHTDEDRLSTNFSNNLTFRIKSKLDTFYNLIVRGNGGWNHNGYNSLSNSKTLISPTELANQTNRDYNADGGSYNINGNMTLMRRFRKPGRSFAINLSGRQAHTDRDGHLNALNHYYLLNPYAEKINQDQLFVDNGGNYEGRFSYTEPLGHKQFLEWNLSGSNSRNHTNTDFYDIIDPGVRTRNTLLSNAYNRGYLVSNTGINYIKNGENYHTSFGVKAQTSSLDGRINGNENAIKTKYNRFLPEADLQYDIRQGMHLNVDYSTNIQEPSLQQLQPVKNNTDPLNIYIGNPDLKPEYQHTLRSSYFWYDQFSFTSLFFNMGANYTKDKITEIVDVDTLFRRTMKPVNVRDEKAVMSSFEFSTPIKPLKLMSKIKWRSQLAKSILFTNSVQNDVTRTGNSYTFSLENRNKKYIDLVAGIKLSGNHTDYSIAKTLNQKYSETNYFGELTITPNSKWSIHSEYDQIIYKQSNQPGSINLPLWTANISTYFGKDNRFKATLTAFDLLNQNKGISRSSQLNYLEVTRTSTLGRYFMIGLAYHMKGFKKQGGIEINMGDGRH